MSKAVQSQLFGTPSWTKGSDSCEAIITGNIAVASRCEALPQGRLYESIVCPFEIRRFSRAKVRICRMRIQMAKYFCVESTNKGGNYCATTLFPSMSEFKRFILVEKSI